VQGPAVRERKEGVVRGRGGRAGWPLGRAEFGRGKGKERGEGPRGKGERRGELGRWERAGPRGLGCPPFPFFFFSFPTPKLFKQSI
jgi:hypothetical protein